MKDYIIGTILTLLTAIFIQLFGCCIVKEEKGYTYKFVMGYLVYSFLVAIVGIPIQILNLSWNFFFWYMCLLLIGILMYIIYSIISKKIVINKSMIQQYFHGTWFLYVGAILLLSFALTHISIIWLNNLSDDAFYLNKIATLPYISNPFKTDYTTGFYNANGSGLAYNLSTFELEASFYAFITRMNPALYARGFLSLFNYFVLLNSIHAFLEVVLKKKNLQYFVVSFFFLFVMCASVFLKASDATWTIKSAAYFGSALIRVGCTFMVLLPLIDSNKLDLKKILITIISCVVMISKSSCALPVLFMLACGYLTMLYVRNQNKKTTIYFIAGLICIIVAGIVFPNNQKMDSYTLNLVLTYLKNPLVLASFVIMIILTFTNRTYLNISLIVLVSFSLMLVPEINDVVETLSMYDFVAGRTIYSIFVFQFIVSYGILILLVYDKYVKQIQPVFINLVTIVCVMIICFLSGFEYTEPVKALRTIKNNIYLIPNSTVLLGEQLEKYYQDNNHVLKMIMTPGVRVDNMGHFSSQIVRSFTPHTESVTGALRVAKEIDNKESGFYGYNLADIDTLNNFIVNPNEDTLYELEVLCDKYPINCIVLNDNDSRADALLESIGFNKYNTIVDKQKNSIVITYNIYVKE